MSTDLDDLHRRLAHSLERLGINVIRVFLVIPGDILFLLIVGVYVIVFQAYLDVQDFNDRRAIKKMQRDAKVTARRMAKVPELLP